MKLWAVTHLDHHYILTLALFNKRSPLVPTGCGVHSSRQNTCYVIRRFATQQLVSKQAEQPGIRLHGPNNAKHCHASGASEKFEIGETHFRPVNLCSFRTSAGTPDDSVRDYSYFSSVQSVESQDIWLLLP
jgi:hypothetical protein